MTAVLEFIFDAVLQLLGPLIWWLIGFPVIWLASLPFILVIAIFRHQPYRESVIEMLGGVHGFWAEWGLFFVF